MKLTTIDFTLLQIIGDRGGASGREIARMVKEFPYSEWIKAKTAAIGAALGRLSEHGLIAPGGDEKQETDFMLRKFILTAAGKELLKQEIIAALSSCRERDHRFDAALAASSLVAAEEVATALRQRKIVLAETAKRILLAFDNESRENSPVPVHLQAFYRHPFGWVKSEIEFMDRLLQSI
ncbi:MAG: hypothetical protein P4N41_16205 [Negativicutes bacterium]|nr:hypothetical protein [Negativicutes bacterium]MDR3591196.1 hypothetical protein [Negativicutes bacterium]